MPEVRGIKLDENTRCAHYHSPLDVVAIKFKCCPGVFYACYKCHEELADHAVQVWSEEERDAKAILCGACNTELSIKAYLECGAICPACGAPFNPACDKHYELYFEM